ncbi:type VI immunity family protein [Cystobacter fuscus]
MGGFHVEYYGRQRATFECPARSQAVSALSFWLPMEYLEEQGPSRVRDMAVAMARELPINSGYVSLSFNYLFRYREVVRAVHENCFRYPGLDVHDLSDASMKLGTRVRGAYWLNFYGQPLLGQLGGAEHLRQQLDSPQVSVEELGEEKVLVALGAEPTTGEVKQQSELHPYRTLARVLEPFLHQQQPDWFSFSLEQLRQWERRFTTYE